MIKLEIFNIALLNLLNSMLLALTLTAMAQRINTYMPHILSAYSDFTGVLYPKYCQYVLDMTGLRPSSLSLLLGSLDKAANVRKPECVCCEQLDLGWQEKNSKQSA